MGKRGVTPLHRGGRVGDDGGEVVGVNHCRDDGPVGVPAPPGERERESPFFFFLDLLLRWDKGSGAWSPWHGRDESPSEIGSVSLSLFVTALPDLAFHRFLYSRRSITPIGLKFKHDFYPDISFLAAKEGHQPPYGVSTRVRGAPLPRGPLGHRLTLIPLPKIHIYFKKISVSFYPVWTSFDIDFLRNKKHAISRNWHWALDQYVSFKNSIKSCQKYMKVL